MLAQPLETGQCPTPPMRQRVAKWYEEQAVDASRTSLPTVVMPARVAKAAELVVDFAFNSMDLPIDLHRIALLALPGLQQANRLGEQEKTAIVDAPTTTITTRLFHAMVWTIIILFFGVGYMGWAMIAGMGR